MFVLMIRMNVSDNEVPARCVQAAVVRSVADEGEGDGTSEDDLGCIAVVDIASTPERLPQSRSMCSTQITESK